VSRRVRGVAVLVLAGTTAGLLAGCGAAQSAPARPTSAADLSVVAVGDSITEADSDDFDHGDIGPSSWAATVDGDGITVLGGWAHSGATTEDMVDGLDSLQPRDADADVLVLMAGNNDIETGMPLAETEQNLVEIAQRAGPRRVLLSAIAPDDGWGDQVLAMDTALQSLARAQGWEWVDPMTHVRAPDGQYRPGTSEDGVHPDDQSAARIGEAIRAALLG